MIDLRNDLEDMVVLVMEDFIGFVEAVELNSKNFEDDLILKKAMNVPFHKTKHHASKIKVSKLKAFNGSQ